MSELSDKQKVLVVKAVNGLTETIKERARCHPKTQKVVEKIFLPILQKESELREPMLQFLDEIETHECYGKDPELNMLCVTNYAKMFVIHDMIHLIELLPLAVSPASRPGLK